MKNKKTFSERSITWMSEKMYNPDLWASFPAASAITLLCIMLASPNLLVKATIGIVIIYFAWSIIWAAYILAEKVYLKKYFKKTPFNRDVIW